MAASHGEWLELGHQEGMMAGRNPSSSQPYPSGKLPSISVIDDFITKLPTHYRFFGHMIRRTGAEPREILALEVPHIESILEKVDVGQLISSLFKVPEDAEASHMLLMYIRGWRRRFKGKAASANVPPQVFLDPKARAITFAMAETAFARASKRAGIEPGITPTMIRDAVIMDN